MNAPTVLVTGSLAVCAGAAAQRRALGWHCTIYPAHLVPDVLALVGITPQRRHTTILIRRRGSAT